MSKLPAHSISMPCEIRILQSPKMTSFACYFRDRTTNGLFWRKVQVQQFCYILAKRGKAFILSS